MPTRLVDCNPSKDGHFPGNFVRVIETANFTDKQRSKPYLTLSHCWGRADCLKLKTSNYDRLVSKGLPKTELPRLYRDCVLAAHEMRCRYIWIDSLCIIQEGDSGKDWNHEVTLMNDVYLRSFCNIAAADCSDANESLFSTRDPATFAPGQLSIPISDGQSWDVFVFSPSFWKWEVEGSILNSRAWVLQERVSSPCVLYFGHNQIFFECQEFSASETFPLGIPDESKTLPVPDTIKSIGRNSLFKATTLGREVKNSGWRDAVEAYSQCNLTYPSDKLPAFAAMSKMWTQIFKDEYVCGLLRRHMEHQLVWNVNNEGPPLPRPKEYRAPSWSWVAPNGKVEASLYYRDAVILVKVLNWHLDYKNPADVWTSQITGGWLEIECSLLRVRLVRKRFDRDDHIMDLSVVPYHSDESQTGRIANTSDSNDDDDILPRHGIWFDAEHDGNFDKQNAEGSLFLMPTWANSIEPEARLRQSKCLLLQLVDMDKGTYSRLGLVILQMNLWRLVRWQKSEPGRDGFPCIKFEQGKHIIRII